MTVSKSEFEFVAAVPLPGDGVVEVRNPADVEDVVGQVPRLSPSVVDPVVRSAHAAYPGWAARSPRERFETITAALAEIDLAGVDELITSEQGKVLSDSNREVSFLAVPVKFLAEHLDWLEHGEDLGPSPMHRSRVYRDPFGVVGIITPWNVPVSMSTVTIAPALVAGNSVVVHVPITTPLAVTRVFRQLADALPDGVLSILSSPDTGVAQALVEHPLVRHVHFTGSTAVGSIIAAEAAPTLTVTTLELGGNDAAIFLDDAIVDSDSIGRLVVAAFQFTGQSCNAAKRLYVPHSRVGEVADAVAQALDKYVVGNGLDPQSTMGPVHTAAGRARVERLISAAAASGADVRELGDLRGDPARGHFLRPTLVTNVAHDAPVVVEEQFGPVLPIVGYDTVDEAVAMANDSDYGLGGSVWSADVERAASVARRLQAGMTWLNSHGGMALDPRVPWGGVKSSGIGRGGSNRAGLETFTEPHAITSLI